MDKEYNDAEIKTLRYIEERVHSWIEQGKVQGVMNRLESYPNQKITTDLSNCSTWLSRAKRYGRNIETIEVYFTVSVKLSLKKLIEEDIEEF